ncbi:MAG: SPOR domain-containing protein [Acetobacter aceti]|uniref:Sporulation protein n=1 Tax=Acetobacter aceti TaxID=435 RepID=A0A1U9KCC9_ACEAC|nr:SPOR domain-containing protein [Acetobacter aceti]AQS83454.1 sporulation protein [Acetobacter aceti]
MTESDSPPPNPHEDRLSRARERMATDYDDDIPPPRRREKGAGRAFALGSLLPADRTTRALTYGAVGLGALLLVGVGGWSLLGHHQSGIPVFGPPPEPIREKPLDPGGMELNDMMPPPMETEQQGATHLAPSPEQPDPAALAARYGAAAKDDALKEAAPKEETAKAAAPPAEEKTAVAGSEQAPAPEESNAPADPEKEAPGKALPSEDSTTAPSATAKEAPASEAGNGAIEEAPPEARQPVAPTARVASKTAKPVTDRPEATKAAGAVSAAASGPYGVQLAALNSQDAALKEWDRIRSISPDLFAGHSPVIEKVTHTNAIFYRLRTRGFDSIASARTFCDSLREHGHACNVLRP